MSERSKGAEGVAELHEAPTTEVETEKERELSKACEAPEVAAAEREERPKPIVGPEKGFGRLLWRFAEKVARAQCESERWRKIEMKERMSEGLFGAIRFMEFAVGRIVRASLLWLLRTLLLKHSTAFETLILGK
jgi:hypothetical protein